MAENRSAVMTVHVKNLAGDVISIELPSHATVKDLKRRLPYPVMRTVLFIHNSNNTNGANPVQLENDRTIESYGIGDESELMMFMNDRDTPHTFGELAVRGNRRPPTPCAIGIVGEHVYIAYDGINVICIFTLDGKLKSRFGMGTLGRPAGICTMNDEIFVSDPVYHCVRVFTIDGAHVRDIRHHAEFLPRGIWINGDELFVATIAAIVVFSKDGTYQRVIGEDRLQRAKDVCVFGEEVFVLDPPYFGDCIIVFSLEGEQQRTFGRLGRDIGQLSSPSSIRVSERGVFVSDTGNNRIMVFNHAGTYQYVIDNLSYDDAFDYDHNQDTKFGLQGPSAMALDGDTLYIANTEYNNVMVIPAAEPLPQEGGRIKRRTMHRKRHITRSKKSKKIKKNKKRTLKR